MGCCGGTEMIRITDERRTTTVAEARPVILVRNVHSGISTDIRQVIDEELLDMGLESEDRFDQNLIDKILTDEFFQQYSLATFSLKTQFYAQLTMQYNYPNQLIDKEDILYLVQRLAEEQYQY